MASECKRACGEGREFRCGCSEKDCDGRHLYEIPLTDAEHTRLMLLFARLRRFPARPFPEVMLAALEQYVEGLGAQTRAWPDNGGRGDTD